MDAVVKVWVYLYIPGHGALPHLPLESGQHLPRSEGPSWQNSTTGWGPPSVSAEHMDQMGSFRKRDCIFILLICYCSEYAFLFPFPALTLHQTGLGCGWISWEVLPLASQAGSGLLFAR